MYILAALGIIAVAYIGGYVLAWRDHRALRRRRAVPTPPTRPTPAVAFTPPPPNICDLPLFNFCGEYDPWLEAGRRVYPQCRESRDGFRCALGDGHHGRHIAWRDAEGGKIEGPKHWPVPWPRWTARDFAPLAGAF